jgi:hypothetical protein
MTFLPKPQVCIIDDEESEYKHLLDALNAEGIGWVHVPGDKVETLPAKPLEGLRIVFLDMHLGTDASKSEREITAHTANVFAHVVAGNTGPLAVIVWTKHANFVESFRTSLFEACPSFQGRLFFVKLEKPVPASKITAIALRGEFHKAMSNFESLALLWGWDALVHRAASDVITELCKLARTQADLKSEDTEAIEREKLLKALGSVLARLIHAETGRSGTLADAPVALQRALEPLLADRVDHVSPKPELESAQKFFGKELVQEPAAQGVLLAINSMLLVGSACEADRPFRPGTLFKVQNLAKFKDTMGVSEVNLANEICQKTTAGDKAKCTAFLAECHIILLEVSPACDFAQGKRPLARLVAGLLVPPSRKKEIKSSRSDGYAALRHIQAEVKIAEIAADRSWIPVFTSAFVVSWPERKVVSFLQVVGRFKEPLLTDVRNWLAHQGGRIGYLYLDD